MNSYSQETHEGFGLCKPTESELDQIRISRDEAVETERKGHFAFYIPARKKLVYDFVRLHFDTQTDSEEKALTFFPSRPLSSINAKAELFGQLKFLVNILFRRSQLRSRLQHLKSKQNQLHDNERSPGHAEQDLAKATPPRQLNAILPVFYRDPGLYANTLLLDENNASLKPTLDCGIFGDINNFSAANTVIKKIPLRSHDLSAYAPKYFPELVVDVSNKSREELELCIPPSVSPKTDRQEPHFFNTYTPPVMEGEFTPMMNPIYSDGPVKPYGQHGFASSSLRASDHRFADTKDKTHETCRAPNFIKESSLFIEETFVSIPAKLTRALSEDILSNSDNEQVEYKSSDKLTSKPVKWAFTPRLNVIKSACEDSTLSKSHKDVRTDLLNHVMYTFSAK
ncbi:unnamed protein product [Phytomonas sp. Hart1]|nr:unnamed protein product [Phytomonas sp. Hart1]|eukprot:CCW70234.1 unnamed protein product [Phytomonas sp. isolate Hart1]